MDNNDKIRLLFDAEQLYLTEARRREQEAEGPCGPGMRRLRLHQAQRLHDKARDLAAWKQQLEQDVLLELIGVKPDVMHP